MSAGKRFKPITPSFVDKNGKFSSIRELYEALVEAYYNKKSDVNFMGKTIKINYEQEVKNDEFWRVPVEVIDGK